MDIERKRRQEQETVTLMIEIYCRGLHGTKGALCPECAALQNYANTRTAHCPFMETKTFCSSCKVHCYRPEMRDKIRAVMKYAGPRMMLYHPIKAAAHAIETMKQRLKNKRGNR
ncbi:MAG: nitrous oxide-stimulated promoter family protein [Eubacteriales bacterium]|nr:nitrous oxide-stimulated promoter family protein [Eubacteriales bacterium]